MSDLRVLMPQRFDVLGRSMDSSVVSQWLWLDTACDLVLWGPGLPGFVPGRPLDQVARDVEADVVLLPDLHHAIPDLWTELWAGVERVEVPVVWHLTDWGSALDRRREMLDRVRPAAVLINNTPDRISAYDDLLAAHGVRTLVVQWGFDRGIFHPPAPGAARDIDLLVCGADVPADVYPVRVGVKAAARSLADRWNVVDLSHPGYWETGGIEARGQSQFADLLRRTRVVTTGTAFGVIARKSLEAAACGAVAAGDLPLEQPDAERLAPATLAVDPAWDVARIARELDDLLRDAPRLAAMAAAGPDATRGMDHRERAHEYVAALRTVAAPPVRASRARRRDHAVKLVAAPEPESVPSTRADWHDVWRDGPAGASRTRRVGAVLTAAEQDVCVVAFDPDAALDVDAAVLVEAARSTGGVAARPAGGPAVGDLRPWAAAAVDRRALVAELSPRRGRFGLEEALLAVAAQSGLAYLDGDGFGDLAAELAFLHAAATLDTEGARAQEIYVACRQLMGRAAAFSRSRVAAEAAGWLGGAFGRTFELPVMVPAPSAMAQDPELAEPLSRDDVLVVLRPGDRQAVQAIAAHARRGPAAERLAIAIPVTCQVLPPVMLATLADELPRLGVDLEACAELILLERPLWDGELAWLEQLLPAVKAPVGLPTIGL